MNHWQIFASICRELPIIGGDFFRVKYILMNTNHPRISTNKRMRPSSIRLFVTPFVDGIPQSKQVQQMIHPNSCQKRTSPSPLGGKLEGSSHAT